MPSDNDFDLEDLDSFTFEDEGTEAPSLELGGDTNPAMDQYGVWVKTGPVDVTETAEPAESPEASADTLPSLDDEEDFLSSEELAKLDDQFDFVVSEQPLEGETLDDDLAENLPELEVPSVSPDPSAELSIEDFAMDDLGSDEVAGAGSAQGGSFDEISLDDFVSFEDDGEDKPAASPVASPEAPTSLATEDDLNEEFLDIDIEIEDDIDDQELEILSGAKVVRDEATAVEIVAGAEEIDLSEFGDFSIDEDTPEPASTKATLSAASTPATAATDDVDLHHDEAFQDIPEDLGADGFFEDEIELDGTEPGLNIESEDEDFISNFDSVLAEEHELPPEALTNTPPEPDLGKIIALEEDLTAGIKQVKAAPPTNESVDAAAAILSKIEQELSSIKSEITDLKKEVSNLRLPGEAPTLPTAEEKKVSPKGFFDEEDDEVIALTGDELDNILNSAEITEEEPGPVEEEPFTTGLDLINTDSEGNIIPPPDELIHEDQVASTDDDFLAGTSLEDSLNEEVELPDSSVELSLNETDADTIPDSIELEDSLPDFVGDDETTDVLGETASPPPSDEGELSIELDDSFTDVAGEAVDEAEFFSAPAGTTDEEHSLEIPVDEEISLDEELKDLDDQLSAMEDTVAPLPSDTATSDFEFEEYQNEVEAVAPPVESVELPTTEAPLDLAPPAETPPAVTGESAMPDTLKTELKTVLAYMDKLLASLPDDKIQEFAESPHFEVYKKLFEQLGLME